MNKKLFAFSLLTIILLLQSCGISKDTIKGDNSIVEKSISISDYNNIEFALVGEIIYEQKASEQPYFLIETDNNLLEYLEIDVLNETLRIKANDSIYINPSKLSIYTNSKSLKKVSISGAGKMVAKNKVIAEDLELQISGAADIEFEDIETNTVNCKVSGAGNINLTGTTVLSEYHISGKGNVNAQELVQETAKCYVSGMGDIILNVIDDLQVSISGIGNVKYTEEPKSISKSISGIGNIHQIK